MGLMSFPVVGGAQIAYESTSGQGALHEPGTIMVYRTGTKVSLVEYVKCGNKCTAGQVLQMDDDAESYEVETATTAADAQFIRGVAAGTIASGAYGWMYIWGYVPECDLSATTASMDRLIVSASTAAKLTSKGATANISAHAVDTLSTFKLFPIAIARGAGSSQIQNSIQITRMWG